MNNIDNKIHDIANDWVQCTNRKTLQVFAYERYTNYLKSLNENELKPFYEGFKERQKKLKNKQNKP